jgi:hypothetical protein
LRFPTGWLSCPHQAVFLAPLPGIEEEEAPTSTTRSHVNLAPTVFLLPLPGKKKTSARGVSHAHSLLCFSFALLYFCLHRFIKKYKKLVSFIVVTLLLLVHYVVP